MKAKYYIVDVFAEEKGGGNQLAVVFPKHELSDEEMQAIALEFHFSETTFVTGMTGDAYTARIFTPAVEVPFAGHPTLGTAAVIAREYGLDKQKPVKLSLKIGIIPVTMPADDGVLWMKQNQPEFGARYDIKTIAEKFGMYMNDFHHDYPPAVVSTGIPFLMIPLGGADALKNSQAVFSKGSGIMPEDMKHSFYCFLPPERPHGGTATARLFAPRFGVSEDPATGSAAGCLGAYLTQYGPDKTIDIRINQGAEVNRPSVLYVKTTKTGDKFEILVGGKVVFFSEGHVLS
ncbi:MAG: PhzF family phenazine biosynthesis protein [Brevinematales bacterium]|nr:PhzF family phenazine biosynthesis protein [Brevinematales bacterium]